MTTDSGITRFIERFGLALEKEGLPRIAGRILGFALSSAEPVLQEDLMAELQISRGSVSTNTRMLEALGVIERVSIAGDRRVRYRLSDDPYGRFLLATVERIQQRQRIIADGLESIDAGDVEVQRRFAAMLRFNELAIDNMRTLLSSWRDAGTGDSRRDGGTADSGESGRGAERARGVVSRSKPGNTGRPPKRVSKIPAKQGSK